MGEAELRRCAEKGVSYSDPRDAGSSCGFGHGLGHRRADALVERLRDDVVRGELVLGNESGERVCRRRALWLPVLIHGMYDFLASLDFDYSGLIFIVFIIVVFLAASRRVKIVSRNDRFIR